MLLSGKNEIKIADLGISKIMEETHASTYAGTKEYMSPWRIYMILDFYDMILTCNQ